MNTIVGNIKDASLALKQDFGIEDDYEYSVEGEMWKEIGPFFASFPFLRKKIVIP
jgi:hypothetical protein